MCQYHTVNSQNLARHLADKIGPPPKTLPWTDKFCHFVMFETGSLSSPSLISTTRSPPGGIALSQLNADQRDLGVRWLYTALAPIARNLTAQPSVSAPSLTKEDRQLWYREVVSCG